MAAKNDITGDTLVSKKNNKAYEDGYDLIFGKKQSESGQVEINDSNLEKANETDDKGN